MPRTPAKKTGLVLPPITFGTSALGNLYEACDDEARQGVLREALACANRPVLFDCAGKYGAGLALEGIGRALRAIGVDAKDVLISNKLGWRRVPLLSDEPTFEPGVWVDIKHDAVQDIGYDGMWRCWEQGCELLGAPFTPQLVSVHDPDEYLERASAQGQRARAEAEILDAYRALHELKQSGKARAIGVGAKDWQVIRWLVERVDLDWVMLACSLTIYRHPSEVVSFVSELDRRGIAVVNSAVFHGGFLTGQQFFDYRPVTRKIDESLFAWRDRFFQLCRDHDVSPAAACVAFARSAPAVASVALNTNRPAQARENRTLVQARIPRAFWEAMKRAGLISRDYGHVPERA